ncbi:MAG: isoprenylcysteine carboxylmethyltransferase family protein, partial [Chloroflexota bacterium]
LIAAVDPWRGAVWTPGLVPVLVGAFVLLWCVRDFYAAGKGTLAPWSPPKKLVTVGLYRLVRNPMYVGVLTLVAGWALYFSSFLLGAYALFLVIRFHMHVRSYEEPWLAWQFGAEWEAYKAAVPRWRPRLQPWDNGS